MTKLRYVCSRNWGVMKKDMKLSSIVVSDAYLDFYSIGGDDEQLSLIPWPDKLHKTRLRSVAICTGLVPFKAREALINEIADKLAELAKAAQ